LTDKNCVGWIDDYADSPKIEGNLEISKTRAGIFIGGDPKALRSLARLLTWLANVDQEALSRQPDGERCHVHLHARDAEGFNSLTPFSSETEVCRLDAKGTGEFPKRYLRLEKRSTKGAKGAGKEVKGKGANRSGQKGKTVSANRGMKRRRTARQPRKGRP
jgi:hypothetical protein